MNYLQRLIYRALAQPRDAAAVLFDPFEQTADALASTAPSATPLAPARPAPAREAAQPPRPVAPDGDQPAPPNDRETYRAGAVVALPNAPADAALTSPADPVVTPRPLHAVEHRAPDPAPPTTPTTQQQADAFMRSLGLPLPADGAPTARATKPTTNRASRPAESTTPAVASAEAPVAMTTLRTPLRPPVPPVVAPPPPITTPAARRLAKVAATTTAAPAAAAATAVASRNPAAAIERIVEKTVVLNAPSRRLDELAHGASIGRFGIGQG